MTFSEWATVSVATYAALLSTAVAVLQQKDKRPRLRLAAYRGVIRPGDEQVIAIVATNIGQTPLCVSSIGYDVPGKKNLRAMIGRPDSVAALPHDLPPGRSYRCSISPQCLLDDVSEKTKVRFHCYDDTNRIYFAKPMPFDPQDYAHAATSGPAN